MKIHRRIAVLIACIACVPVHARDAAAQLPLDRVARLSPFASRSVLLHVTDMPNGAILAVGERGHILYSKDRGRTWTQSAVPVSVTLTAGDANGRVQALVVGHGLTVLRSVDAGHTWLKQTDGRQLASRFAAWADEARRTGNEPLAVKLLRLSEEGADKPLLDVLALDDRVVFAVGAYGVALQSSDGGQTWDSAFERFPGDEDRHFNAMRRIGSTLWIAGERGLLYRSSDAGGSFAAVESPTQASLFAIDGSGATVVAVGLRGTIALSTDAGVTWQSIETQSKYSFTSLTGDPADEAIYWAADDSGGLWRIDTRARQARPTAVRAHGPVAALYVDDRRTVTVVGALGVETLGALPAAPL